MRIPAVLSQAWASWRSAPGVALLAIVAFAVGIGSATAIFTVINGVMLRPLPYPEGERFVALYGARVGEPGQYLFSTFPDLIEYQQQTTSFDVFGWFRGGRFNLTSPGEPQSLSGAAVTPSLAHNLGVNPVIGRWFSDETGIVISNRLWRRLGGRADMIGSAITLDERPYTVTGIMPVGFRLPVPGPGLGGEADLWIWLDPTGKGQGRGSGNLSAYARRKPGVSLAQAQADAKRVAAVIAAKDPARHERYTAEVVDLRETTVGNLRSMLFVLFGAAVLLLLVSCANVATLLLARSVSRARETAIRVALGASHGHLAVRYFVEGAGVSLLGAAAGVGLSILLVRVLLAAAFNYVPYVEEIGVDWKVLGFGVAMALAAGTLAGMAPLWQALRTAPNAVLTDGVRASASAPARRLSRALVVAEVALAFTLLTVSVMLVVHLRGLDQVQTGFNPDELLAFEVALPQRVMASVAERMPAQRRLVDALLQTPGITSATYSMQVPLKQGCGGGVVSVADGPPASRGRRACYMLVTPEYLRTMELPLRAGRFLSDADFHPDMLTAVVNETAVRTYWPDRNPVGASGRLNSDTGALFHIVGVVGDVRNNGLNNPTEPEIYLLPALFPINPMNVLVRSSLPEAQLAAAVRRTIQRADPTLALRDVRMMRNIVRDSLQLERISSLVMTFFAMAALLMATLGIYGVVSYSARQRTVELGTRMALGAVKRDLLTLVLGGGLKLSVAGVAIGSAGVVAGAWLLIRFLQVRDIGWLPFASSTVVVTGIAAAAAYVPAWRATLLSPMVAIRDQPPSIWRSARQHVSRVVRDVTQAVAGDDVTPDVSATNLLTAFVAAARTADSYTEALQAALAAVCKQLGVESAALLERGFGGEDGYSTRVAIGALAHASVALPQDGFLIKRLEAYPLPLPFARTELAAVSEWATEHRPERLDEIRRLAAADVRLAVPLRTRTDVLGVLLLGAPSGRDGYTPVEKQVLRPCADQFALMIENARLTDRVVEQEALRRDVTLAAEVQKRLLPDSPPVTELADFEAISLAARRIGGDYYDFIDLGDRRIGIALADVSGKGVAAALIMSVVQASLRIISSDGDISLPRLVARLNQFVYRSTPSSKYATFFYAEVNGDRRLRYVNAGHNPPYLVRAGRRDPADGSAAPAEIEELSTGGTVVGMFPDMAYEEATIDLQTGDVLLIFTDGVPEAHNPANEEFGEDQLKRLLCESAHLPASDISARLAGVLSDWVQDGERYDDLTFIVMKVH